MGECSIHHCDHTAQQRILSWLQLARDLPIPVDQEIEMLHGGDPETPTRSPKKRKGNHDPDDTPRAVLSIRPHGSISRADSLSETSSSLGDSGSRASSPSKTRGKLANVSRDAIRFHTISEVQHLPPQSTPIIRSIRSIGKGRSFLPASVKHLIASFIDPDDAPFVFSDDDRLEGLPGNIPPPEAIRCLVHRATRLEALNASEASWNQEIHHRLMQLVLRPCPNERLVPPDGGGGGGDDENADNANNNIIAPEDPLVDVLNATTADTHSSYRPARASSKKVDYIIFINPDADPNKEAIRPQLLRLAELTYTSTVNPTAYPPLSRLPTAICIKTKKPGTGAAKADVQAGVWHASHWKFLETHRCRPPAPEGAQRRRKQTDARGGEGQDEDAAQTAATDPAEGCLPRANPLSSTFLPGLIVEGHDWRFIFSTWDDADGATTVWGNVLIGTTRTLVEAYQVVAGLRLLVGWVEKTYWPLFQKEILAVGGE